MRQMSVLFLIAAIYMAGSVRAEEVNPPSSDKAASAFKESLEQPSPLVVWNRTIVVFRTSYNDLTPADRARLAKARIEALPARAELETMTFEVKGIGFSGIIISIGTVSVFGLLPGDVDTAAGETLETAARAAADRLKALLDEHAAQLKWTNLVRNIGLTVVATLIFILTSWGILRIQKLAMVRLERGFVDWLRPLSLAGINLVPILLFVGRALVKLTLLASLLATSYLWLAFCLAQFFFTEPYAERLGTYLVDLLTTLTLGIVEAAPGLFTVIVIFWLTRVLSTGISQFFLGVEKGTISVAWLDSDSARASRRIVIAGIWVFALTIAYPYIPGSGSDAFKGISVFAGLMLSLGSTGFINHVMSGLVIAYSGSMRVGDYVSVQNIEGTVHELGLMSTKISTPKKELVSIPNGVAISAHVTNYSRLAGKKGAIISTTITIGYDAPWRQVHTLMVQAAEKTTGILPSPAPFVLQRALSDFYVEYELRVCIDQPVQRLIILSALHAAIQDVFNEASVQIMSPHFVSQPDQAVLAPKSPGNAPATTASGKQDMSLG
jgi:small-conductance mechanosensitive channel